MSRSCATEGCHETFATPAASCRSAGVCSRIQQGDRRSSEESGSGKSTWASSCSGSPRTRLSSSMDEDLAALGVRSELR